MWLSLKNEIIIMIIKQTSLDLLFNKKNTTISECFCQKLKADSPEKSSSPVFVNCYMSSVQNSRDWIVFF